MKEYKFISQNEDDTIRFGLKISQLIKEGMDIIFADEESRDNIINNKKQESKNSSKIQYINGRKINKKIFHPDHYIENEKVEVNKKPSKLKMARNVK